MILGITGGFGSGKTTVANLFRKYDFKVINVDKLYSRLFRKNKSLRNKITNEFGTLNRNDLRKIVFNDYKKLKKLNSITHPLILKEIKKIINNEKNLILKSSINKNTLKNLLLNKKPLKNLIIKNNKKNVNIIIDAPLLLESKAKNLVDKIIVVKCKKDVQMERILKKKKYTKEETENIIKSQMPLKEKLKYADFVVDNSNGLNKTKSQVEKLIKNPKF